MMLWTARLKHIPDTVHVHVGFSLPRILTAIPQFLEPAIAQAPSQYWPSTFWKSCNHPKHIGSYTIMWKMMIVSDESSNDSLKQTTAALTCHQEKRIHPSWELHRKQYLKQEHWPSQVVSHEEVHILSPCILGIYWHLLALRTKFSSEFPCKAIPYFAFF